MSTPTDEFSPAFSDAFDASGTPTGWHTVESARDEWPDAPYDHGDGGDDTLLTLLAVAKDAVLAYAPATAEPLLEVPIGYRSAQLKAARNSWTDTKQSRDGFVDAGQYGIPAMFEPWHQDVRPKTGKPWIG